MQKSEYVDLDMIFLFFFFLMSVEVGRWLDLDYDIFSDDDCNR